MKEIKKFDLRDELMTLSIQLFDANKEEDIEAVLQLMGKKGDEEEKKNLPNVGGITLSRTPDGFILLNQKHSEVLENTIVHEFFHWILIYAKYLGIDLYAGQEMLARKLSYWVTETTAALRQSFTDQSGNATPTEAS